MKASFTKVKFINLMLGGIDVEEDDVDQKLTKKTFFKENHHCFNNKMKSIIYE